MPLDPGSRVLERYLIKELLGEGGMGQVYAGVHERLDLAVALKVLNEPHTDELIERFEREAKLLARVRHPNVVSILDYGFLEDGSPCIAMEFINGDPLDSRMERAGAFPWTTAMHHMLGLLAGLEAMHLASVLHRDLKPGNIVLAPGRPEVAKLIDFGIARPTGAEESKLTVTGTILGTPAYMAPEQILFLPIDESSDLYSMGLIFYEMLTGAPPFPGSKLTDMMRRMNEPPKPPIAPEGLPDIQPGLQQILLASLEVNPKNRLQTAREYIERLEPLIYNRPVAGSTKVSPPPSGPFQDPSRTGPPRAPSPTGPPLPPSRSRPPQGSARWAEEVTADTIHLKQLSSNVTADTVYASAQGAHLEQPEDSRYLVLAKLPPSRLADPDERAWLANLTIDSGRSYTLGAQLWMTLQLEPTDRTTAESAAQEILMALDGRYGTTTRVEWTMVDQTFSFTASSLSGATPLPKEFKTLMDKLSGS